MNFDLGEVQGLQLPYMKAIYVLVYLHLTRGARPHPALQMATMEESI